jgi:chemotaxis signal transduction protein
MLNKSKKFISFYLGGEQYAIAASLVNKFIELENLSSIPGVGQDILGLIYNNGHIITIIDIKKILKLKSLQRNNQSTVLIFEYDDYHYGILVDQGGESVVASKILNDRQHFSARGGSAFGRKKYIKTKTKDKVNGKARGGGLGQKIYILEADEILSQINIYDQ